MINVEKKKPLRTRKRRRKTTMISKIEEKKETKRQLRRSVRQPKLKYKDFGNQDDVEEEDN